MQLGVDRKNCAFDMRGAGAHIRWVVFVLHISQSGLTDRRPHIVWGRSVTSAGVLYGRHRYGWQRRAFAYCTCIRGVGFDAQRTFEMLSMHVVIQAAFSLISFNTFEASIWLAAMGLRIRCPLSM
jgi:hypothetical protein